MVFDIETLAGRRRLLANAFASRLCNIQNENTATGGQKLQTRNTQKALGTSISFRRIPATVRAPHRKDKLVKMEDRKRVRIRGIMRRPILRMKGLAPALQMGPVTHRALACRWRLGKRPIYYRFLPAVKIVRWIIIAGEQSERRSN